MRIRRIVSAVALAVVASLGAAAPSQAQTWPAPGKPITIIVPWSAGGGNFLVVQQQVPYLSKELGVPVNAVSVAGAASQIGMTEFIKKRPDGYTIASLSLPGTPLVYLDPDRQAAYSRKNFTPLGLQSRDSIIVAVSKDSPYKTLQDLLYAAKANPGKITMSGTGVGGIAQYAMFDLEKKAGVKFRWVANEGQQDAIFNVVGGHVDSVIDTGVGSYLSAFKSGQVRVLANSYDEPDKFPGVPTFKSLGYDVQWAALRGLMALAGTPPAALAALEKAMATVQNNPEFKQAMISGGSGWIPLMGSQDSAKYWDELDATLKVLIPEVKSAEQ